MAMRSLVTGGTGFIGRHLVRRLLDCGETVRCLIRRQPDINLEAEYVYGDVTKPETLDAAVQGVDRVYHVAGATLVLSRGIYKHVNDEGTRNLAAACARVTNPPTVVFVSSLAAAGPSGPDSPRVESQLPAPVSAYGRSKLAGEGHFKNVASVVPTTILRPPVVFGPWDPNTLRLFRNVRWGVNFIPGSGRDKLSLLYVDDLVNALILAAERGRRIVPETIGPDAGCGIYFTALDEFHTLSEMGQVAARALNIPSFRTVFLPRPICWFSAYANQALAMIRRRPVLVTPEKLREAFAGSWICSSHKAKVELGLSCVTPLAEGFRRTADWYVQNGWL